MSQSPDNLHRRFDHAALLPEVDRAAIIKLCREAKEFDFATVAVNPTWVSLAAAELQDCRVAVLTVSGFPLGAATTEIKIAEALKGVADGASEIDMVANIGWLVSDRLSEAESEISQVRQNLPKEVVLKVIIEAGKLTPQQQADAARTVIKGGGQFVKTCTGFFGGATVAQVQTLSEAVGGRIEVKASGGIRTLEQCRQFIKAGATRLGSSASVAIMREARSLRSQSG